MNTDVPEAHACECPARPGDTHVLARPRQRLATPRRGEGIGQVGRGGAVRGRGIGKCSQPEWQKPGS